MNSNLTRFHLLICVYALFVYTSDAGNTQWRYFYRTGNAAILGDEFRSEYGTMSRFDCLRRCLTCHAVLFNENTKDCRHYVQQNSTVVPAVGNQSGVNLWISQHMKISAAKYSDSRQMTFEEAKELCMSLSGRLATYRELANVRSEGFHLCCCGWLSDGTSRAPLAYNDPGCDVSQSPGLHTCKIETPDGRREYLTHYEAAYCIFTD